MAGVCGATLYLGVVTQTCRYGPTQSSSIATRFGGARGANWGAPEAIASTLEDGEGQTRASPSPLTQGG
jgi:hypothetical protein